MQNKQLLKLWKWRGRRLTGQSPKSCLHCYNIHLWPTGPVYNDYIFKKQWYWRTPLPCPCKDQQSTSPHLFCSIWTTFCLHLRQGQFLTGWLSCHIWNKLYRDVHLLWSGMGLVPEADISPCQRKKAFYY